MTHWLTKQTRIFGAVAALCLGLPATASAEPADKAAQADAKKHGQKKKAKRTAQAKPADKKAHKPEAKKAHGKPEEKGKADKPADKKGKAAHRGKTAQAHGQPTRREQPKADRHDDKDDKDDTCVRAAVELGRTSGEEQKFVLTRCKGKPADKAIERLSVLMRPYSVDKPGTLPDLHPKAGTKNLREGELLPGIHAADPGLLSRLQAIASEFPERKITIISGYRPGGKGVSHRHGRAVDIRVEGVKTEELATFCRGLVDTGCGFHPNGDFIHLDVRPKGTGHAYWIDAAGPGEAPHFVSSWPPPKDKSDDDNKTKPHKDAPLDDANHADTKKKAGHGPGKADRDHDDLTPPDPGPRPQAPSLGLVAFLAPPPGLHPRSSRRESRRCSLPWTLRRARPRSAAAGGAHRRA